MADISSTEASHNDIIAAELKRLEAKCQRLQVLTVQEALRVCKTTRLAVMSESGQ